jgi:hypothetical protein
MPKIYTGVPWNCTWGSFNSGYYTNTPQIQWLRKETLFPIVLEGRKFEIKVMACLGSDEAFSWLVDDSSCCVCAWHSGNPVSSLSCKVTNSNLAAPPSWPHLNFITSQRLYLQIPSHCWLGLQHMIFGGRGRTHKHSAIAEAVALFERKINDGLSYLSLSLEYPFS